MVPNQREEEKILRVVLEHMRNVWRSCKDRAKVVRVVRRLRLTLTAQRKVLRVKQAVASLPEERAVGLAQIEAPEIKAASSATAAAAEEHSTRRRTAAPRSSATR